MFIKVKLKVFALLIFIALLCARTITQYTIKLKMVGMLNEEIKRNRKHYYNVEDPG